MIGRFGYGKDIITYIIIVLLISGCITRPSPSPKWFIKKEWLEEKYPNHWIGFGQSSNPKVPMAKRRALLSARNELASIIEREIQTTAMPSLDNTASLREEATDALTILIINQALPNSFLIKEEIIEGVIFSAVAIDRCGLDKELFEFLKDTHPELYERRKNILDSFWGGMIINL